MNVASKFFLICFYLFFINFLFAESVGEPVMEPGLNAFVLEKDECLLKLEMEMGFLRTNLKFNEFNFSRTYLATGIDAYLNGKGLLDFGLSTDLGLAGKENYYFSIGPKFRLFLSKISFLAPLYIKGGASYASFKNSFTIDNQIIYSQNKGMALSYGGGLYIATSKSTVFSVDYERAYLFPFSMVATVDNISTEVKNYKIGYPVIWHLVLSFGVRI